MCYQQRIREFWSKLSESALACAEYTAKALTKATAMVLRKNLVFMDLLLDLITDYGVWFCDAC